MKNPDQQEGSAFSCHLQIDKLLKYTIFPLKIVKKSLFRGIDYILCMLYELPLF